jgi:hypothetical protein
MWIGRRSQHAAPSDAFQIFRTKEWGMANSMPAKWVLGKRRRAPEPFFSPGVARLTAETDEVVLRGEFGHSEGRRSSAAV